MKKVVWLVVTLLMVAVLVLSSCTAAPAEEEEALAKKYVTDPTTGKPVIAPEYGGIVTVAAKGEPENGDTFLYWGGGYVVDVIAEQLAIGNWAVDRDEWGFVSEILPLSAVTGLLAESWETPDDKTIIFNIRKGVYWHDKPPMNGRELTAKDIEYNYHRFLGLGSGFTEASPNAALPMLDVPIESVEATDDWTVVFKLKEPRFTALDKILAGDWTTFMYPPEVIKQHGDLKDWRNLVGTGPYELTDWVEGTSLTYTKNPNYWRFDEKYPENRLPYIEKLEVVYIDDEATRVAGLRAGTIDYTGYIAGGSDITSIDQVDSLRRTDPEIVLWPYQRTSLSSFAFDQSQPPFDDINVRKAMQMALDLETINLTFYKGTAIWQPQGSLGEALVGYHTPFDEWPAEVKKGYMYDPEEAGALLDAAGYPRGADGTRFRTVVDVLDIYDTAYAELATTYWKTIGVDVEITIKKLATWAAWGEDWDWQGMRSGGLGKNEDALTVLHTNGYSTSLYNIAKLKVAELDAWIDGANAATSTAERQRLAREADMYMIKNHWGLWGPKAQVFMPIQPWVKGYNGEIMLGQMNNKNIFARLWIDQDLKEAMGH